MENSNLIPFEGKEIRKVWHDSQWYFSVIDVIEVLTNTSNPQSYWGKLKERENQLLTNCQKFKFLAPDGKNRSTDCATTEGIFRIIMSVSSPKAEPLKLWLAEQGKRAIDETENPELLTQRQIEIYKSKGYSDEWIEKRVLTIETRNRLTDEWKARGVKEGKEYSHLTSIIAKGTFGVTPTEHKKIKGLEKPSQNLRDHMTPLELIFTQLGEELTRDEAINDNAQGFDANKGAAIKGGNVAGKARKLVEAERGQKVVSKTNYLNPPKDKTGELPESGEPKD
jgi:DNA-damage-inducible protein D